MKIQNGQSLDTNISPIKEMRLKTYLSQEKFGKLLGIPTINISRWEQGKAEPPSYVISLIQYKLLHIGLLNQNDIKGGTKNVNT